MPENTFFFTKMDTLEQCFELKIGGTFIVTSQRAPF